MVHSHHNHRKGWIRAIFNDLQDFYEQLWSKKDQIQNTAYFIIPFLKQWRKVLRINVHTDRQACVQWTIPMGNSTRAMKTIAHVESCCHICAGGKEGAWRGQGGKGSKTQKEDFWKATLYDPLIYLLKIYVFYMYKWGTLALHIMSSPISHISLTRKCKLPLFLIPQKMFFLYKVNRNQTDIIS